MSVRNLFDDVKEVEQASTQEAVATEEFDAEAGAFEFDDPNKCPKCQGTMGTAFAQQEPVLYCATCRVTAPMPETDNVAS